MAHARLHVQVSVAFVLQPTLQRTRVQREAIGHFFHTKRQQCRVSGDEGFDLGGHPLALDFLAQAFTFGAMVWGGKRRTVSISATRSSGLQSGVG